MDEPSFVVPSEIEYWLNHLLQPLVVKVTDLEAQVATLNNQVAQFVALLEGFRSGGNVLAKRLLGVT